MDESGKYGDLLNERSIKICQSVMYIISVYYQHLL
jgi:hypothetical protein